MRTIVITNQKGGVGKTTTTISMAAELTRLGYNVLAVDFDPQGDLTFGTGTGKKEDTIYELMEGKVSPKAAIVKRKESFDLIPADLHLAIADTEYAQQEDGYNKLKNALKPIRNKYDFVIIDSKPSFGLLPINAMMAADDVIVPIESGVFSIAALDNVVKTIEQVKGQGNKKLCLRGILITRCTLFTNISKEVSNVATQLSAVYQTSVFKTAIHNTVDVPEAQKRGIDVGSYRPKSKAAKDYAAFVKEYLEMIGNPPAKGGK